MCKVLFSPWQEKFPFVALTEMLSSLALTYFSARQIKVVCLHCMVSNLLETEAAVNEC